MRILQVFEKIGHGGTEKMIKNLSMGIKKLGHETCLWTRQEGEVIKDIDIITDEKCPWNYEPDIILVHGGYLGAAHYFDLKEKHSVPIVEVVHRNVEVDGTADFYISPNTYNIKTNQKLGNIQHIDNPIYLDDLPIDREKERLKYGISKDDFVIVRHARFDADKGWPRFMWVMDKILEKNKNVVCLICGEGDAKTTDLLHRWAKGKRCRIMGWKNDTDTLLKISDLYLETSLGEAFGMSAVEAAMCHLPIVMFNVPGLNEVFGRSRYCVPDNDLYLCIDRIQELLENKNKCLQEGSHNFELVCNKYDIEHIANEYLQCLEKICDLNALKSGFIRNYDHPLKFHEMLRQPFCKKFGISYCIRIYWLLFEWLYRMHTYGVDENVNYILRNVMHISPVKRGINEINLAVELIAPYSAEACCLNKAIVKAILLYENGYDSILVYGVLKNNKKLDGHSWIEMRSGEILDCQDAYKSCKVVMKKNIFHELSKCRG